MKTIDSIKKEIRATMDEILELNFQDDKKSLGKRKRLRSKLPQLRQYILYLETNPTKEFLQQEIKRLQGRIDEIMRQYIPLDEDCYLKPAMSAHKKKYEKELDISKIKKQLTAINYIIKK